MEMDEAAYKAFWVGYGMKYAIGAAAVLMMTAMLHAVTTFALSQA